MECTIYVIKTKALRLISSACVFEAIKGYARHEFKKKKKKKHAKSRFFHEPANSVLIFDSPFLPLWCMFYHRVCREDTSLNVIIFVHFIKPLALIDSFLSSLKQNRTNKWNSA